MPLQTADIRKILQSNGTVRFGTNEVLGKAPMSRGSGDPVVESNYTKMTLQANLAANEITMMREKDDSAVYNGVDVQTEDAKAMTGAVSLPGYIYTGNFSGCVFYLYKTGVNEVTGVHAYSGEVNVATKAKLFRKKTINKVVREFSPQGEFLRQGARLLDRYATRGEIDPSTGENGLSFLSCIEGNSATTFLFSLQGAPGGSRVRRLLRSITLGF